VNKAPSARYDTAGARLAADAALASAEAQIMANVLSTTNPSTSACWSRRMAGR